MDTNPTRSEADSSAKPHGTDFAEKVWEESWTYIKTVVDTVHEPFLILDKNMCIMVASESFYRIFKVEEKDTENKLVYKIGNGQWDIPSLRQLLEDILPKNTFFKGYQVIHDFPGIGRKVMILNARRVYREDSNRTFPPIILLAMEDVTEHMSLAEKLAEQASLLKAEMQERTSVLEAHIEELGKEIQALNKNVLS